MRVERLSFIHRFEPAQEPSDRRVLLLLHGTGGDENQLIPLARTLAPRSALLSPRGKVMENGNARFFRRLAEGVFDEEDLIFRAGELADFITEACREYNLDCGNITAVGYSNGANIAAALMLLKPKALSEAVLFRPMVPLVPKQNPDLSGKRIFIAAGELDPMVPFEETTRLYDLLREFGADVTLHWERAGHTLTDTDIQAAEAWMETGK